MATVNNMAKRILAVAALLSVLAFPVLVGLLWPPPIDAALSPIITARRIVWGASLPATCSPSTGDMFFKTASGIGPYFCSATNTWSALTSGASGTVPFSSVTAGTNTTALVIGTAGSLDVSGTGSINATKINGTAFAGTNGNVVSFGASNIPADSGIATSTVVKGAAALDTAGYVAFITSAGTLTIDKTSNGQFFWDNSAHCLAIGQASCTAELQVFGTAGNQMWMISSTALGSSSGASASWFTNNLPNAADQRLGAFTFGYLSGGTTARNAVAIEGFSNQAWTDGTVQGSYVTVAVTANGAASRTTVLKIDNSTTTNDVRLLVYDATAAALVRVSRGASDSGGSGFRLLRIPN